MKKKYGSNDSLFSWKSLKNTIIFSLFVVTNCFAQTVIEGVVTDSLNNPLSSASLVAQPKDSIGQILFSISGDDGAYKLVLDEKTYVITTRYLGYEPFDFEVLPEPKQQNINVVLTPQLENLDEIVLELPVIIKKDTIIYDVDKFTTGDERKLRDVLEKLPGVDVDEEGNIYVQGKKASRFLVENKDFFGGDSKLGVENIPADAIDKVEALDNYNEIEFLRDLDNKDELAINIKLKEGKKKFVFGRLDAGFGNRDFYSAHSNLYYYSKKTSANSIANFNNIGERAFTYRQYSSFKGSLNSVFSNGSTLFENSENDLQQFVESEDVIKSRTQFGALNIFHEVGNKLNISGYGIFSRSTESRLGQANNLYNTFNEERTTNSSIDNRLAVGDLKATYLPNLNERWDFKTHFKYSNSKFFDLINSTTNDIDNTFNENLDNNSNYFNQIIEWHKNKSKNHRFSFGASYTYNNGDPRRLIRTSDSILSGLIPIESTDTLQLKQLRSSRNHQANAILKYYWIIDRNNHIYTTLGGLFQDNDYFSRDFQVRQDGSVNDFNSSGFGNDLSFRLSDIYLGIYYKRKAGKFTFGQGLFLHNYDWKIIQETAVKKNKWVLLPNASIDYNISSIKEISLNYSMSSNFVSVENYAKRFLIESYNSLFRGNQGLENELSHSLSLSVRKISTYRGFGYYALVNYRKSVEGVQRAVITQNNNQSFSPIFLQQPSRSWRFSGLVYRRFSKVKLNLAVGFDDREYDQQLNGSITQNNSSRWSYRINAKTNFKDFPTLNIGLSQIWNSYKLGNSTSDFVTTIPSLSMDYALSGFILSAESSINYYKNRNLDQSNQYSIFNASLFYEVSKSPWTFEFEVNNIFDVSFKNQNLTLQYIISDTRSFVLPRVLLFKIGYRL